MSPLEKFSWYLRAPRTLLTFVSLNIFEENFHYSFGSYLVIALYVGSFFCYGYNLAFSDDTSIIIASVTYFIGYLLVRICPRSV